MAFSALQAQAQTLRFVTQHFPPFSYESGGAVAGPAAEIISEACRSMGVTCEFSLLPWIRAQEMVKNGRAQGMFVIGRNPEREGWLYYSPPLFRSEYGFFIKLGDPLQYKSIEDLKGLTVGVYGPSNTSAALMEIRRQLSGKLLIDMTPDDESALRKLSYGRIRAVFSNRDVGLAKLKEMGLRNVAYAGAYESVDYYVGFSMAHTDVELVGRFNEALWEMAHDGRMERIAAKYGVEAARQ